MRARRVHAVMAAAVDDPELIARWRREPALLRAHGVDPAEIDLDGLWKFAALTLKVRHNGIREDLPLTFRLLGVAGLEIEVFGAYGAHRAARRLRYADSADGRARDFVEFLAGWIDPARSELALLWDLIRHERALAQLSRWTPEPEPAAAPTAPRVRGAIVLHEMSGDPRAIAEALRARAPRLDAIAREPVHLCYWRAGGEPSVAIVELDAATAHLLSLIDGARPLGALPAAWRDRLAQLVEIGMVDAGPP